MPSGGFFSAKKASKNQIMRIYSIFLVFACFSKKNQKNWPIWYCRVAVCATKIFLFFQSSNTYVLPRATSHPHLGHFSFPNLASSTSQDPNTVNCAATACRMLLQRHLALGRTPKCAFVPRKSRRPSDPPPSWRRPLGNYLRGVSSCSRPVSAGRMRRTRGPHQGG